MHHLSFSYPLQANRYVIQLKNLRAIMASVSPQALSVMGLMIAEMAVTKLLTADLDVVSINIATHLHHCDKSTLSEMWLTSSFERWLPHSP